jgi:outer membrane receptor protein involved in Fe transport
LAVVLSIDVTRSAPAEAQDLPASQKGKPVGANGAEPSSPPPGPPADTPPAAGEATAAAGAVEGVVSDEDGAPVAGAAVRVVGAGLSTVTGDDGRYVLRGVAAGEQRLEIDAAGYAPASDLVHVEAGATVKRNVSLFAGDNVIVIEGKLLQASRRATILQKRFEVGAVEVIGKQELSQGTDSDVAEAATRVPSVTLQDGKFAFIRGLGGRYSQTLVNGSNIPSPEPDMRVVPLDLFPVEVVESIVIAKTYSPDRPGEFSGGSVLIDTVGVPAEAFFKIGTGFDYRAGTTLDRFESYDGGDQDIFAVADATRDIPDAVPQESVRVGDLTDQEVQTIGRSFENIWEPESFTAPFDHKLGLSFGDSLGESGVGPGRFGFVGAVHWANKYQTITDEDFRVVKNAGSEEEPEPFVFNDFELDRYLFEAELSGVLNMVHELNEGQKFGWRNLYTRSATDRVLEQSGIDGQQDRDIRVTQLRYVERSLWSSQLFGEHLLVGDTLLKWRGSYSLSQRDEPDNRQVRYDFIEFINDYSLENVSGSGRRDFYQLDENIWDGAADFYIPLPEEWKLAPDRNPNRDDNEPEQKLQIGVALTLRDRDFDARRFRFIPSTVGGQPRDENGNLIDLTASPEDIFREKNINPQGFVLTEVTRNTDNYEAEQTIYAGYAMLDFRLADSLRLQTGMRAEQSDQEVTTFRLFGVDEEEVEATLDELDYMPAFNLTWEFLREEESAIPGADDRGEAEGGDRHWRRDMQLRLAGSQTVSRPEFRELAEFEFTDVQGGYAARGNPNLDRARIWNFDLGWEWFPFPSDLISASLFYKHFDKPIEQVIIPTGSALIASWDNAEDADLYGFEMEVRKNLGFIDRQLKLLSFVGNFAWIESEVSIEEGGIAIQTNDNRALQGQPDYVLNVGLLYDNPETELTATIFANTFGESLSAVGALGVPDEEQQPHWDLSFAIAKKFGQTTIKLSGENLLNDRYQWKQGDITTREYRTGIKVGLSLSYEF